MTLRELLKNIDYKCVQGNIDCEVTDLIYDSRKVTDNTVFFCIDGFKTDGHAYANDAAAKGAAAIIASRDINVDGDITVIRVDNTRYALAIMSAVFFGNPGKEAVIIGITGTKGKTSTAFMIKDMLDKSGNKCGIIGTIGAFWDNTKIKTGLTTPESYVIHSLFRKMVDDGCKYIVMEVSSQALKLDRTAGIEFDYGIFTNFSPDHISDGEHTSLEEYRECKELLFKQSKVGIFNTDDEVSDKFIRHATCEKIYTYSMKEEADFQAVNVKQWSDGGKLGIEYDVKGLFDGSIKLCIPGKFNVYNSIAALAVAYLAGVDMKIVPKELSNVRVLGRVELVHVSDEFSVIVDYAHNEVSTRSVMETLREYKPNRIICIYGGGGNRARIRRYDMGEVTGEMADLSILTCDNPRDEEISDINNDIKAGLAKHNGQYVEIEDRTDAIEYAIRNAVKGDIILLLGKGHEDYQEIKGVKYHYDEREAIREAAKRVFGN